MSSFIQELKIIVLALIIGLGLNVAQAASTWVGATAPPPGNNTDTPINTGTKYQQKKGILEVVDSWVSGALVVEQGVSVGGNLNINSNTSKLCFGTGVNKSCSKWSEVKDEIENSIVTGLSTGKIGNKSIGTISVGQVCIGGDCKANWPSGLTGIGGGLGGRNIYTDYTKTSTYTPAQDEDAIITVVGGGGGGGGGHFYASDFNNAKAFLIAGGSGGGSGGYYQSGKVTLKAGTTYSIRVGRGGCGGKLSGDTFIATRGGLDAIISQALSANSNFKREEICGTNYGGNGEESSFTGSGVSFYSSGSSEQGARDADGRYGFGNGGGEGRGMLLQDNSGNFTEPNPRLNNDSFGGHGGSNGGLAADEPSSLVAISSSGNKYTCAYKNGTGGVSDQLYGFGGNGGDCEQLISYLSGVVNFLDPSNFFGKPGKSGYVVVSTERVPEPPVGGACGQATGSSAQPTSGFCSSGSASGVSGTGPWTWTCNGQNGGASVSCSTPPLRPASGQCGSLNGSVISAQPSGANLCASGSASAVSGAGPWTWTCSGQNGGASAFCQTSVENGSCGTATANAYSSAPSSDLCVKGTASPVSGSGPWTWYCNGIGGGSSSGTCTARTYANTSVEVHSSGTWTFPATAMAGSLKAKIIGGGGGGTGSVRGKNGSALDIALPAVNPGDTLSVEVGKGGEGGTGAVFSDCGNNGILHGMDNGYRHDNKGGLGGLGANPGASGGKGGGCIYSNEAYQAWGGGGGGATSVTYNGTTHTAGGGKGAIGLGHFAAGGQIFNTYPGANVTNYVEYDNYLQSIINLLNSTNGGMFDCDPSISGLQPCAHGAYITQNGGAGGSGSGIIDAGGPGDIGAGGKSTSSRNATFDYQEYGVTGYTEVCYAGGEVVMCSPGVTEICSGRRENEVCYPVTRTQEEIWGTVNVSVQVPIYGDGESGGVIFEYGE